ncbi:MAG: hypothetical protein HLUCCO02_09070 [Idiomarinaceae bacterium HL-53]|nr:MAG: hypothetical protein HLUCCO02_09070 [Idiomarinaceae bacterium HL-53]CUS47681.1 hypothetical protein Ga0003345_0614 [Idiomarinaceae bacterium HL-53]
MNRSVRLIITSLFVLALSVQAQAQSITMKWDLSPQFQPIMEMVEDGDLDGAVSAMERLDRDSRNTAEYYFMAGQIDVMKVNEASALRAPFIARSMRKNWEKALEIDPSHELANFSLAMFYAAAPGIVGGDKDEAQRLQQRLVELESEWQYPLKVSLIGMKQAETEEAQVQRTEELKAAFGGWAEAQPDALTPRLSAASLLINEKDWEAAEDYLTQADALAERNEEIETEDRNMISYQWGKFAATSGQSLEVGRDRLLTLVDLEAYPAAINEGFVHFRLAQVFTHMNLTQARELHLEKAQQLAADDEQLKDALDEYLLAENTIAGG